MYVYTHTYISTPFAHSCHLTAHPSGLLLSDVLNTTAKISFSSNRRWEDGMGRIFYPRERKKTKPTKFMSSTEDKPACKYSVCASKNWKQLKNCGFLPAPLSREGRGRPWQTSPLRSRETGLCFCWCLLFLSNPCTALRSLRCRNTAGRAKPSSASVLHLRCCKPS